MIVNRHESWFLFYVPEIDSPFPRTLIPFVAVILTKT